MGSWKPGVEDEEYLAEDFFFHRVPKFNEMYKLPVSKKPEAPSDESLLNFKSIILEEVQEIDDVIALKDPLERMTALTDWLCDLIVYCSTKAHLHGLPTVPALEVIMQSNFSKLDANGEPIYDARGKVMKGLNYWKPEPKIKALLAELLK
jgi:predicted HAD superfamily Cof-like phosphohydrolase